MPQTKYLSEYGPSLLGNGYDIVPIRPGTKYPGYENWQKTKASLKKIDHWTKDRFKFGGVGVLCKNTPAIDIDVRDSEIVHQLIRWCEENIGAAPKRIGCAPKTLLVYKTDKPFPKIASKKYVDFLGMEHKVEILGDGQQFVAFAIHPDTKLPYEWSGSSIAEIKRADLVSLKQTDAERLIEYFESIVPDDWEQVEEEQRSNTVDQSIPTEERILAHAKPPLEIATEEIEDALELLDPDMRMLDWARVGMALYHQFEGDQEGFRLWDNWSSQGQKYNDKEMDKRWKSFEADLRSKNPVTLATVLQMAKRERLAAPKDTTFKLVHARDVMSKLGPIRWLIDGYLEVDTTGTLFGDPASYKSFIALDMALCVAAGKSWHGREVKAGSVVYIAGEGHNGLARRFAAWERGNNQQVGKLPFYVSEQAAHLYDRKSAKQVVEAVLAVSEVHGAPAMIVIDTLARNFGPGDENSNTDMGVFIKHVDGMLRARFKSTVVIVHHTGHTNKSRGRGAAALRGGMDFEFRVERQKQDLTTKLICTKMKDAREPSDTFFEAREMPVGGFEDENEITSLVFEKCDAPVEKEDENYGLRGRQLAVFQVIQDEGPVERDVLRNILLEERLIEKADQIRIILHHLKNKHLIQEIDKKISILEEKEESVHGVMNGHER